MQNMNKSSYNICYCSNTATELLCKVKVGVPSPYLHTISFVLAFFVSLGLSFCCCSFPLIIASTISCNVSFFATIFFFFFGGPLSAGKILSSFLHKSLVRTIYYHPCNGSCTLLSIDSALSFFLFSERYMKEENHSSLFLDCP